MDIENLLQAGEMLQFVFVGILLYLLVMWYMRSLKICRYYGDLYVVVTGCDSGFGRELAYRLDRFGFNVFAACLKEDAASDLESTTSNRLRTVILDVTNQHTISNLLQAVKRTIPNENALWGVVNNAGIFGQVGPCDVLSKEHYMQTLDVNLFGMMEVNKQFLPLLRKSKGRIINIASVAGRIGSPVSSPYTLSKFGVEAYSDCLRRELYYQGVSVHIIEPGLFATSIVKAFSRQNVISQGQDLFNETTEELRDYYGPNYAVKVGEVMEFVCQFASKDTYKVINAYFHALTARFPKSRYVVGIDANTMARLLWSTPDWFSDFCVINFGLSKLKPAGLRK